MHNTNQGMFPRPGRYFRTVRVHRHSIMVIRGSHGWLKGHKHKMYWYIFWIWKILTARMSFWFVSGTRRRNNAQTRTNSNSWRSVSFKFTVYNLIKYHKQRIQISSWRSSGVVAADVEENAHDNNIRNYADDDCTERFVNEIIIVREREKNNNRSRWLNLQEAEKWITKQAAEICHVNWTSSHGICWLTDRVLEAAPIGSVHVWLEQSDLYIITIRYMNQAASSAHSMSPTAGLQSGFGTLGFLFSCPVIKIKLSQGQQIYFSFQLPNMELSGTTATRPSWIHLPNKKKLAQISS